MIGVAVFIITAALAWVAGLFRVGRNVKTWEIESDRAKKDYAVWRERADREFAEELERIDENHNTRWGLDHPGLRLAARARATERIQEQTVDQMRVMSRRIDDAFHKLRRVDLAWLAIKHRKSSEYGDYSVLKALWTALTRRPGSMENQILEPVVRKLKDDPK